MYVITFNPDQPYDILVSLHRSAWETEREALRAAYHFELDNETHGEPVFVHEVDWPGSSIEGIKMLHPVPQSFIPVTCTVGYDGCWTLHFGSGKRKYEMHVLNGDARQALMGDMVSDAMGSLFILDEYIPDERDAQWWLMRDGVTFYGQLPRFRNWA